MLFQHHVRQWSHAWVLFGCALAAGVLPTAIESIFPGIFDPVELWTVDRRFQVRADLSRLPNPGQARSNDVVEIDYDDLAARKHQLGRWPWDRRVHARLIDWLKEAGARIVVVDLLFNHATRDPREDPALIEATKRAGNVIYPFLFRPVSEEKAGDAFRQRTKSFLFEGKVYGVGEICGVGGLILPIPGLVDSAFALGHILRTPDTDGVLRRIPLICAVKGGFVPALALAAAFKNMSVDPTSLVIERGRALRFKQLDGEEVIVPIDKEGRTWINYAGPWATRFTHVGYSWLLDQLESRATEIEATKLFKGKTVVVANLTTGAGDQGGVPFERDFPFGEVHLHLLNMLATRQFLRDAKPAEVIAAMSVPLITITGAALAGGAGVILPVFTVALGLYIAALQYMFDRGVILPAVTPILAMTMGLVFLMATRFFIVERERRRVQDILDHYLPTGTKKQIRQNPQRIAELLKARTCELTIMFTDIKGFSDFCNNAHPDKVQQVLKSYLTRFTDTIWAYGGTVDRYIGDGILAFFGDADPDSDSEFDRQKYVELQAANAVLAGVAMQRIMLELNRQWRSNGDEEHLVRIGINTGFVTVGNLGTDHLWDYTVVGTEANKAQRLESKCQPGGLLLGKKTYALA